MQEGIYLTIFVKSCIMSKIVIKGKCDITDFYDWCYYIILKMIFMILNTILEFARSSHMNH
jgi:hypothetical protein